jgi:hypothetical protein
MVKEIFMSPCKMYPFWALGIRQNKLVLIQLKTTECGRTASQLILHQSLPRLMCLQEVPPGNVLWTLSDK